MTIIDHATGAVIRSQRARSGGSVARPALRLLKAPRGASSHLTAYPAHAYAGTFNDLVAEAATRGRAASIVSHHRFRPGFVESRWSVVPHRRGRSCTVRLTFPSWGKRATITAVMRDGRRLIVGSAHVPLAELSWLHIAGADRGYVIVPRSAKLSGRARVLRPEPQGSAPHPGPTLVLELLSHRRLRRLTATVRYAPAKSAADAERVARVLRRASS